MTDALGNQVGSTVKYLPFGETRSTITVPTDKLFTDQSLDSTGLYYYNARYYDPTIGRFISADIVIPNPANPQCFNRYSYCLNNPLRYTDSSGQDPYWDLIHYCEISTQSQVVLNQLPQGYGTGLNYVLYATEINQTVPTYITDILNTATAGGGRVSQPNLPLAEASIGVITQNTYLNFLINVGAGSLGSSIANPVTALILEIGSLLFLTGDTFPGQHAYDDNTQFSNRFDKNGGGRTVQSGGKQLSNKAADQINEFNGTNYNRRVLGRALERLKNDLGVSNSQHGIITANGNFYDSAGRFIGNLLEFL